MQSLLSGNSFSTRTTNASATFSRRGRGARGRLRSRQSKLRSRPAREDSLLSLLSASHDSSTAARKSPSVPSVSHTKEKKPPKKKRRKTTTSSSTLSATMASKAKNCTPIVREFRRVKRSELSDSSGDNSSVSSESDSETETEVSKCVSVDLGFGKLRRRRQRPTLMHRSAVGQIEEEKSGMEDGSSEDDSVAVVSDPIEDRPLAVAPSVDKSVEELTQIMEESLKLSAANKISQRNVWSLQLVRHMPEIISPAVLSQSLSSQFTSQLSPETEMSAALFEVDSGGGHSAIAAAFFMKASSVLGAATRIYAVRVDELLKLTLTVQRELERGRNNDDEMDDAVSDENAADGSQGASGRRRRQRSDGGKKNGYKMTAREIAKGKVECEKQMSLSKDPMFHRMSTLFDESRVRSVLQNVLSVSKGGPLLLLDSAVVDCFVDEVKEEVDLLQFHQGTFHMSILKGMGHLLEDDSATAVPTPSLQLDWHSCNFEGADPVHWESVDEQEKEEKSSDVNLEDGKSEEKEKSGFDFDAIVFDENAALREFAQSGILDAVNGANCESVEIQSLNDVMQPLAHECLYFGHSDDIWTSADSPTEVAMDSVMRRLQFGEQLSNEEYHAPSVCMTEAMADVRTLAPPMREDTDDGDLQIPELSLDAMGVAMTPNTVCRRRQLLEAEGLGVGHVEDGGGDGGVELVVEGMVSAMNGQRDIGVVDAIRGVMVTPPTNSSAARVHTSTAEASAKKKPLRKRSIVGSGNGAVLGRGGDAVPFLELAQQMADDSRLRRRVPIRLLPDARRIAGLHLADSVLNGFTKEALRRHCQEYQLLPAFFDGTAQLRFNVSKRIGDMERLPRSLLSDGFHLDLNSVASLTKDQRRRRGYAPEIISFGDCHECRESTAASMASAVSSVPTRFAKVGDFQIEHLASSKVNPYSHSLHLSRTFHDSWFEEKAERSSAWRTPEDACLHLSPIMMPLSSKRGRKSSSRMRPVRFSTELGENCKSLLTKRKTLDVALIKGAMKKIIKDKCEKAKRAVEDSASLAQLRTAEREKEKKKSALTFGELCAELNHTSLIDTCNRQRLSVASCFVTLMHVSTQEQLSIDQDNFSEDFRILWE